MKNFFVRVELQEVVNPDLQTTLQALMAKNGFRAVAHGVEPTGEPGVLQLPPCFFAGTQISEATSIRDSLFHQIEEISPKPMIMVIEAGHWAYRD